MISNHSSLLRIFVNYEGKKFYNICDRLLKRKILIKNKRLRPDVERYELELFKKGELAIEDSEEEKEDPKVRNLVVWARFFSFGQSFLAIRIAYGVIY